MTPESASNKILGVQNIIWSSYVSGRVIVEVSKKFSIFFCPHILNFAKFVYSCLIGTINVDAVHNAPCV